jgi:hypothetical protein
VLQVADEAEGAEVAAVDAPTAQDLLRQLLRGVALQTAQYTYERPSKKRHMHWDAVDAPAAGSAAAAPQGCCPAATKS